MAIHSFDMRPQSSQFPVVMCHRCNRARFTRANFAVRLRSSSTVTRACAATIDRNAPTTSPEVILDTPRPRAAGLLQIGGTHRHLGPPASIDPDRQTVGALGKPPGRTILSRFRRDTSHHRTSGVLHSPRIGYFAELSDARNKPSYVVPPHIRGIPRRPRHSFGLTPALTSNSTK